MAVDSLLRGQIPERNDWDRNRDREQGFDREWGGQRMESGRNRETSRWENEGGSNEAEREGRGNFHLRATTGASQSGSHKSGETAKTASSRLREGAGYLSGPFRVLLAALRNRGLRGGAMKPNA